MWRPLVFILATGILLAPQGLVATAQDATPLPLASNDFAIDLAALTLRPQDLDALGLGGFGLANQSSLRDAQADALLQAGGDSLQAAERLADYQQNGFQRRYVGSLLKPDLPLVRLPSGLVAAEERISTAVAEYATAEGATLSFAFMEGEMDDAGGQDVPGTRVFGDESEITRSTGIDTQTGDPIQRLELTFRLGNHIGEATIVDFHNVEPDVETIEQLGEALVVNIERGRDEPGPHFSPRVLRITPLAPWIESGRLRDFYVRLDRIEEPMFAQIVAAVRAGQEPLPSATPIAESALGPTDTYMFWTPVGNGDPITLPLYVTWIDRFDSPEKASAALKAVTTDLGPGYFNVRELAVIAETVGNESRTFAYRYDGDPDVTVRGYVVMSRIDNILVRTQVDAPEGVRREGVATLAQRQVACLEQPEVCEPVPMLRALTELVARATEP